MSLDSNAYHVYHDWEGSNELSASIARGLAEVRDRELENLGTPLYDAIDPDALEALLGPRPTRPQTAASVQFTIDDYSVTAYNDSSADLCHIVIQPYEENGQPPLKKHV